VAFENEILAARFNRVLTRIFAMVGQPAPAPVLNDVVSPGITLESDRAEWKFHSGEKLSGNQASLGAVAAQFGKIQLFNPAGSGILVIVDRIEVALGVPDAVAFYVYNTAFATLANAPVALDTRWVGPPVVQTRTLSDGTQPGSNWFSAFVLANALLIYDQPVILAPGTGIYATTITANELIRTSYIWRERVAETGELGPG
jgi:hypothetical protein